MIPHITPRQQFIIMLYEQEGYGWARIVRVLDHHPEFKRIGGKDIFDRRWRARLEYRRAQKAVAARALAERTIEAIENRRMKTKLPPWERRRLRAAKRYIQLQDLQGGLYLPMPKVQPPPLRGLIRRPNRWNGMKTSHRRSSTARTQHYCA
jgi:hypothetical protein